MFKIARGIARHKIGVIAVIAIAVFIFAGSEDDNAKPSSPWGKNAPVQASVSSKSGRSAGKTASFTTIGSCAPATGTDWRSTNSGKLRIARVIIRGISLPGILSRVLNLLDIPFLI